MAAIALFSGPSGEFMAQRKGKAEDLLINSLAETNEVFWFGAVCNGIIIDSIGIAAERKENDITLGNNAASGAAIKASSWEKIILAITECFWQHVAQLAASCWAERVASEANPADAPSRGKPPFRTPDVEVCLESLQTAPKLSCVAMTKKELARTAWRKEHSLRETPRDGRCVYKYCGDVKPFFSE